MQPIPLGTLPTASLALMAAHHFTPWSLADDGSISLLHAPRHRRPYPRTPVLVASEAWIPRIMAMVGQSLFLVYSCCLFAAVFP